MLIAVAAVIALVMYFNSLVKTYTATQPQPLPKVEVTREAQDRLKARWTAFQKSLENRNAPVPAFKLTADDLNLFLAGLPGLSNRVYVSIEGDQLKGQFSVPLNNANQPKLNGRFVNGSANLKMNFDGSFLTVTVASVEANNQPLPKWLLRKVQGQNLVSHFDNNTPALELFQRLDNIEVRDGAVVLTPVAER